MNICADHRKRSQSPHLLSLLLLLFCCNTANPSSCQQNPCFYGSWQRVMVNFVPDKVQQAGKLPSMLVVKKKKTHLICFFSSKLFGRSRMARIRSRVDRSTSSLTRFSSSVTHKIGDKRGALCYLCTRRPLGIQIGRPSSCYTRGITPVAGSLPFSNSSLMASSVMASWVGSAFGIMLILFIASPLHLTLIVPGCTRPWQGSDSHRSVFVILIKNPQWKKEEW